MKIDVIVTSHARSELLGRCLDSLSAQTRPADRIILCNDDGDPEVRRIAAEKLRRNDLFLSVPHLRGPAESRNLGIDMSDADWFVFLDDDDSFAPGYLKSAEPFLKGCEGCIPYGDYEIVKEDENGSVTETRRMALAAQDPADIDVANFIHVSAFFVPARLRSCRFDTQLRSVEDWDYLLALSRRAPLKHFPFSGSRYHQRPVATRNSVDRDTQLRDRVVVYSRHPAPTADLQKRRALRLKRTRGTLSPAVL